MKTPVQTPSMLEAALFQAREVRDGNPAPGQPERRLSAERLAEAVRRAVVLRSLARAAEETGFLALPLDHYLLRLAHHAGVRLDQLLPAGALRGGIAERLSPWLALAEPLQLGAQNLRLWVRAWFAEKHQTPASTLSGDLVMARGGLEGTVNRRVRPPFSVPETASPDAADTALRRLEGVYSARQRQALDQALQLLG